VTKKIVIFSDAHTALHRLRTDDAGPGQCIGHWINQEAAKLWFWDVPVEFQWVLGHIGVPENEAADAASKRATKHRCTASPLKRYDAATCHTPPWASLAHVSHLATETQSHMTTAWIAQCLADSKSYKPKAKWGIRKALCTIPKRRAAVFLQLASGHALIGMHLARIKKREADTYWWCDSGRKQMRGHLFGGCRT
jgi:hypothetical protein